MSFFVSGIFRDVMEVFATDDKSSMHFGRDDGAGQDTSTNRDFTGERTFFVCGAGSAFTTLQPICRLQKCRLQGDFNSLVMHTNV